MGAGRYVLRARRRLPHRQRWERAPPARSPPAPFGAAGSCPQRVQGRVGAGLHTLRARRRLTHRQHWERAPPARSPPVPFGAARQHWERAPPARSPPAPFGAAGSRPQRGRGRVVACLHTLRVRAFSSLTGSAGSARRRRAHHLHHPATAGTIRRRRFSPLAGGRTGRGRVCALRAHTSRSLTGSAGSARLRRAHHLYHPTPPLPAPSGGGSVCPGSTPPPHSPAALGARASGALITCTIRHRRFPPPAGAGQGRGGSVCPTSTPPTPSPAAL